MFRRNQGRPVPARWTACLAAATLVGCSDDPFGSSAGGASGNLQCEIPGELIFQGGPGKDGIPALTDPTMVPAGAPGSEYLFDDDRVIGIVLRDEALAVPLNIGWWHEIVNLDAGDLRVVLTHCPLTGSSLAFDRSVVGGAEFGVSGLLFMNNLIMYDRNQPESLWPQMLRRGGCGQRRGVPLSMVPIMEMTWRGWRTLHPETRVVSSRTGYSRDYRRYPYGNYDVPTNAQTLFPMPSLDVRRPPKERVLGIPDGPGGIAFPFGALDAVGAAAAVHAETAGTPLVVFWNRAFEAAMAFRPVLDGAPVSFEVRDGRIVDLETGSAWEVNGTASSGPRQGARLQPVPEAFVSFWFAWAAFYPDAALWTGES